MIVTMHGLTTMHCNLRTEIRIAREAGYDALEITVAKLERYMDVGLNVADLIPVFDKYSIRPVMINALYPIEFTEPKEREAVLARAERVCTAAEALGCPTIQVVPLSKYEGRPWPEVLRLTAGNLAEIADIGKRHRVRFQIEPVAWTPIHSLRQSLELMDKVGRDNVAMVIDFWHLAAGGETTPDEVAKLKGSQIYGVHFCDGLLHTPGTEWDEYALRSFLPGEGQIPIKEWVAAVKATGFDGVWSGELLSPRHWEEDLLELAIYSRQLMEKYIL
jgi:sugar phosphate isomerase/epimerase